MAKSNKRVVGKEGEIIASEYFVKRGYRIISQNFRIPNAEIDLIAEKNGVLVFAEVKSLTKARLDASAEEKIDLLKKQRIIEASQVFCLKEKKLLDRIKEIRYDVLIVDLTERKVVRHYESAFFAED